MRIIALSLLSLLPSFLQAEVNIPLSCRVSNRNPGYCCWASLETLGKLHHIVALKDLVDNRAKDPDFVRRNWHFGFTGWQTDIMVLPKNVGTWDSVTEKLDDLKVDFTVQHPGNKSRRLLLDTISKGYGCVIAVDDGSPTCFGPHAVVLVDFNDKQYRYVDSNDVRNVYVGSIAWFDLQWSGFVCVVYPLK